MKKVNRRNLFTLVLVLLLAAGMVVLLGRYLINGADWAGFAGNRAIYQNGRLTQGTILDRNGEVLYDAAEDSYNESQTIRTATLHVVGDREGKIATSAQMQFGELLCGFDPITGVSMGGNDLYLTIDADACAAAYQALSGYKGCVAVYNYQTGEILCLVSAPSYDPENVPVIEDGDSRYEGAYLNRVYSSSFTPGSTFKIVTLAAALENLADVTERTFTCDGDATVGGAVITCPRAHGTMTIADALAKSCNGVFGELAQELGEETMLEYIEEAGLLERHEISGITTGAGFVALEGNLGWSGVGQGQDLVNPAAMLRLMGAIANDGVPVEPRILLKSKSGPLNLLNDNFRSETGDRIWSEDLCDALAAMMRNNVLVTYGQERFGDLLVCAKSGTAEVGSGASHSWFVGFVDDDSQPYAFVAVAENAGAGSGVAANAAAAALNALVGE